MKKNYRLLTALVCISLISISLFSKFKGGMREEEIGSDGGVVIVEEGVSDFGFKYDDAIELIADNRVDEAESVYRYLMIKEPASSSPFIGAASCCMHRGEYEEALELYQKALEINPSSIGAYIGLGSVCSSLKRYEKSIENYLKALTIDNAAADAHWGLVVVYADLNKHQKARLHLNSFKKLAPNSLYISGLEDLVNSVSVAYGAL